MQSSLRKALLLGALALSPVAEAQTTETEVLVVRGRSLGPSRVEVRSEVAVEDAAKLGDDLGEILTQRSGVQVLRHGGLGSRSQVVQAGLGQEQTRIFVDGLPVELTPYVFGVGNLPPALVSSAEIFEGSVPIRFASDALAGAIDVHTEALAPMTGADAAAQIGSFGTYRFSGAATYSDLLSGLYGRVGGFVDRADNDYAIRVPIPDPETGRVEDRWTPRLRDAYAGQGLDLELGWRDAPWIRRLTVGGFVYGYDKQIPHNVVMSEPYGEVGFRKSGLGVRAQVEHAFDEAVVARLRAVYARREAGLEDRSRCAYDFLLRCGDQLNTPGGEIAGRPRDTLLTFEDVLVRGQLAWNPSPDDGFGLSLQLRTQRRSGEDAYLQELGQEDRLEVPVDVATAFGGLRYTRRIAAFSVEAFGKSYFQSARLLGEGARNVANETQRDLVRGGAGLVLGYRLDRDNRLEASYELTSRLPDGEQYFGDGVLLAENPNLLPESSHNLNVGAHLGTGRTGLGALRAKLLLYGRFTENLIYLEASDEARQYQNVAAAHALGTQLGLRYAVPGEWARVELDGVYNDIRNRSRTGLRASFLGQRIPNRPYLRGTARAVFRLRGLLGKQDQLELDWATRYVDAMYRAWAELGAAETKEQIPTQVQHGVTAIYSFPWQDLDASLAVGVRNLTNELAYDVVGVQRPGRAFHLTLTGRWRE